jgi:outer membrane receptor for ferrienterochelin and colicins
MKLKIFTLFLLFAINSVAQNTYRVIIRDKTTNENLVGAVVQLQGTQNAMTTDRNGEVQLINITDSVQVIVITILGYETFNDTVSFPTNDKRIVYMVPESKIMDEVIVEGTRSNKSIDNIPTRVEVLNEEIDEASTMDPSKIAHLLTHSTGIQVQQTSATSNTANVRIQGLDGRYTQILKDGFPLYGGFSGSLCIMQIPPLDLRQIEYIKGGASTLYGGGAISGLTNIIGKEPYWSI